MPGACFPNRREFVKYSLGAGAALTSCFPTTARPAEPLADRLRVGCIGVGGRGSYIGNIACKLGQKIACADVDRGHAEQFAAGGSCHVYTDYRRLLDRRDIDVVTIGTPDHWHTKILIDALQAGKDVYCEKPLTLTIDEGKKICRAVRHTRRIVQVGTQQRSSAQFLMAVALAQSGRLGKVLHATCTVSAGPAGGPFPTATPPQQLDWNAWLGQCPLVDYSPERCHGSFRFWLEYSGGLVTDWGAHHVDIAQWALGYENSGPVEIEGHGDFPAIPPDFDPVEFFAGRQKLPNAFNTATTFRVTHTFANGSTLVLTNGDRNGILIEGEHGRIHVNRGALEGKPVEDLTSSERDSLANETVKLYRGKKIDPWDVTTEGVNSGIDRATALHMANFFDCIQDRSQPISDVFTHHRTVSTCHLSNIAMLLRRKLHWNPAKQDFTNDPQATALLSRPQRPAFSI